MDFMMRKFLRHILAATILVAGSTHTVVAQNPPRLVVNIVVSSRGANDVEQYEDNFTSTGFRRLLYGGQRFTNATYDYMQTSTPVSLATLTTGAMPSIHGVVGERWFDYVDNSHITLIDDEQEHSVNYSSGTGNYSPRNLIAETLSDALARQSVNSRIATIAVDPLSAIVMAGHSGEVYWMESVQTDWTTSSYYTETLPEWVAQYNEKDKNQDYSIKRWTALLPYDSYRNSQVSVIEGLQSKTNKQIVHVLDNELPKEMMDNIHYQMCYTPAGNSATLAFARELISKNEMGKDDVPDMINIVLDAPRMISSRFGPESVQYQDMIYPLDRDLEEFFTFLATQVKESRQLMVILTSDHGTSPSYNDPKRKSERFNVRQAEVITNAFIGSMHGNGEWVLGCIDHSMYLNHNLIIDKGLSLSDIQNDVATFVMQLRGVSQAITAQALRSSYFGGGYGRKIQNGYYARRSGDVVINLMPGWIDESEGVRSSSGSMYRYDSHVPLIIYGGNTKAVVRDEAFDMTSLAATEAYILGIAAPSAAEGNKTTIIYE